MSLKELRARGYCMTERQWLTVRPILFYLAALGKQKKEKLIVPIFFFIQRILFLESVAGVPGMVAAACRHLRSLRLMKRDAGWIHTLLQGESEFLLRFRDDRGLDD